MTEVLQRVMKSPMTGAALPPVGAVTFITELIGIYIQFNLAK
jgi:hypothetical protein